MRYSFLFLRLSFHWKCAVFYLQLRFLMLSSRMTFKSFISMLFSSPSRGTYSFVALVSSFVSSSSTSRDWIEIFVLGTTLFVVGIV